MKWFKEIEGKRPPDFVIGNPDDPYMMRWWVIPRNRFFNIYLHKFLRPDEDPEYHDHPWINFSYLLQGWYIEQTPCHQLYYGDCPKYKIHKAGHWRFRWASSPHRISRVSTNFSERVECWSLFITGPIIRRWGFYCKNGWKFWKDFLAAKKQGHGGCA